MPAWPRDRLRTYTGMTNMPPSDANAIQDAIIALQENDRRLVQGFEAAFSTGGGGWSYANPLVGDRALRTIADGSIGYVPIFGLGRGCRVSKIRVITLQTTAPEITLLQQYAAADLVADPTGDGVAPGLGSIEMKAAPTFVSTGGGTYNVWDFTGIAGPDGSDIDFLGQAGESGQLGDAYPMLKIEPQGLAVSCYQIITTYRPAVLL